MALKLKGSTSGFVGLDAPAVAGNNTLILPENAGSAFQLFANDITAGVTTFTTVTVNRNGDLTVPGTISIGGTLTYEDVTNVDSVGIITARSTIDAQGDVSIADKIIHTGDTDTSIRFSQDDQIQFETAGVERLEIRAAETVFNDTGADTDFRIESDSQSHMFFVDGGNNRIGVNVDTPLETLHTKGSLYLTLNGSNANEGNALKFQTKTGGFDTNYGAAIHGLRVGDASSYLRFDTGGQTERMRITSAGSVGIGTNNPTVGNTAYPVVQVHGTSTNAYFKLTNSTTGVTSSDGVELSLSGSDAFLTNRESANIIFRTAGSNERLRITSSGSVGIGTIAARGATLEVQDIGATGPCLLLAGASSSEGDIVVPTGQDLNIGHWNNVDTFTERLRINSAGQVGINTTTIVSGNNYATVHIGGSSDGGGNDGGGNVFIGNVFGGGSINPKNAQLTLGGRHNNTGYNDNGQIKLYITGSNNDGTVEHFPLYVEDENAAIQMCGRQKDQNFSFGVKTAAPELSLHVRDGALSGRDLANSNCDALLEGTSTTGIQFFSGDQVQLRFGDAASTAAGAIIYQHTDDQFKLNYSSSGTLTINNSSQRVKVDANGYVHLSAQPIMHAYGNASSGSIESSDNGVPIPFDSKSSFSRGITDSNSRSRFTVPVAGIYHIHCTIGGSLTTSTQSGDGVELEFKKNGSTFPASSHFPAETFGSDSGQEWSLNATCVMELAANDYIEAVLENIGSTTASWGHRYFIMYKIM